jgi:uncharacterized repeat protein (TIGR01451 family)
MIIKRMNQQHLGGSKFPVRTLGLSLTLAALLLVALSLAVAHTSRAAQPPMAQAQPLDSNVGGVITQSTTWTVAGSPYILTADVVVTTGVTLTIEPGVEVRGNSGTELDVLGHLEAVGTVTQPITFTSATDTGPGQWQGLFFDGGTGQLDNVTVRYGAELWNSAGIWAAVAVRNVSTGEVSIANSRVYNNASWAPGSDYALYVENSHVAVSNTLFTGNGTELSYDYSRLDAPLYITGASSVVTLTNNVITANIRDRIVLAPGAMMSHDTTLARQAALQAYELAGDFTVPPTVTLTVEPGVTVMSYHNIELDVYGHLEAVGTPSQPIMFTSVTNTGPAQWQGLFFDGGTGRLDNVTVRYGDEQWNNAGIWAAVAVRNVLAGEVSIVNSRVYGNVGLAGSDYALYVENSHVAVSNTLFTGNGSELWYDYGRVDGPLYIAGPTSIVTLTNNTFTGNIRDRVVLAPGAMISNTNVTLTRQAVLQGYEFGGDFTIPAGVTLTVEPGLTVMGYNNELTVKGRLVSSGTSSEPITFTSVYNSGPCQWTGLVIDGGSAVLSHTNVLNGGGNWTSLGTRSIIAARNASSDGVRIVGGQVRGIGCIIGGVSETGVYALDSRVVVSNTTFTDIGNAFDDCALNIAGASSHVQLVGNTIHDNNSHGVCVNGDGSTVVLARNTLILNNGDAVRSSGVANVTVGGAPENSNDIMGNGGYGINQIASSGSITATYNWWGDPTGPYHPTLNPGGKGSQVSDHVLFDPWLTTWTGAVDRGVLVNLAHPGRVFPGGTADYAVGYMNLMTTTVQSATLVLNIPGLASYVESTGGGLHWPQRHQVFWKLGDLAPGVFGTISARLRYQWGIPEGTRDGTLAALVGANLSQPMFDVNDYLSYVPQTVVQETTLTQAQFDAELQSSPDLNTLYTGALASGFISGTLDSLDISTGQIVTQAILAKPDLSAIALVFQESGQAMAMTMDRTSMAIATASGGVTINLQTGTYQQWSHTAQVAGPWGVDAERNAPTFSQWDCLMNCAVENVGGAILGQFVTVFGVMQSTQACITWVTTGDSMALTNCIAQVPGAGIFLAAFDCYTQYVADPESCKCKDNKFECKRVWWGQVGVWKTPCNQSRGMYETSQAEMAWYCPFCTVCVAGIGGSPMDRCRPCGTDPCPEFPKPSLVVQRSTAQGGGTDCDKTCAAAARDPNAMYGPIGDLLPGQRVTYTITYENEGAGRAYGVYISDQLGEEFDAGTLTIYGGGQYAASSRKIFWFIGEVGAKGEPDSQGVVSFTVQLEGNLPGGTPIINQAVVYFPSVPEETPTNAVVNVIQPVVAVPQDVETTYMQPVSITLEGLDVGGAPLTFTITTQPLYGYLSSFSATAIYTPAANFVGVDDFTFVASNGVSESRPAEVQIMVSAVGDTTPPKVYWTEPPSGAIGIDPVAKPVYTDTSGPVYAPFPILQFSEPVSAATVTTATLRMVGSNGVQVPTSVAYDGTIREATLTLRQPLQSMTWYTATVTSGVKDLAGNSLPQDYVWSFRTGDQAIAGLAATNDGPTTLGQSTTLTATVTTGTNVAYTWAFDDGEMSNGAVVTHTYPAVGPYTAVVTAANPVSVLTATTAVTITDVPVAGLTAVNDGPTTLGQPTTLTATVTAGTNVTYTWAFGDTTAGAGAIVTHVYPTVGVYTATVTATNGVGSVSETTVVTIKSSRLYLYLPLILRQYP